MCNNKENFTFCDFCSETIQLLICCFLFPLTEREYILRTCRFNKFLQKQVLNYGNLHANDDIF